MCNTTILPVFFFFTFATVRLDFLFFIFCYLLHFTSAIQIANVVLVISSQVKAELSVFQFQDFKRIQK